jgi:transcriptional regulator with XRE-family HTH domain
MVGSDEMGRAIGEQIRRVRGERGESQEDTSLRSGLHRTEISQIERGLRVPRVDTLLKLASAFEVEIGELVGPLAWSPGVYHEGSFTLLPQETGNSGGGAS